MVETEMGVEVVACMSHLIKVDLLETAEGYVVLVEKMELVVEKMESCEKAEVEVWVGEETEDCFYTFHRSFYLVGLYSSSKDVDMQQIFHYNNSFHHMY